MRNAATEFLGLVYSAIATFFTIGIFVLLITNDRQSLAAGAPAPQIKIGDTVYTPSGKWLKIRNPSGVANWAYNETCLMEAGNQLTVRGFIDERPVVEYSKIKSLSVSRCPTGVISVISREEWLYFAQVNEEERSAFEKDARERKLLEDILNGLNNR